MPPEWRFLSHCSVYSVPPKNLLIDTAVIVRLCKRRPGTDRYRKSGRATGLTAISPALVRVSLLKMLHRLSESTALFFFTSTSGCRIRPGSLCTGCSSVNSAYWHSVNHFAETLTRQEKHSFLYNLFSAFHICFGLLFLHLLVLMVLLSFLILYYI